MQKLKKKEIVSILSKVKTISETERNPDWQDNKRRMKGGKVCNRAAAPKDLGTTRRNQKVTEQMRELTKLGHLEECTGEWSGFPYFRLTDAGAKFLAENSKK